MVAENHAPVAARWWLGFLVLAATLCCLRSGLHLTAGDAGAAALLFGLAVIATEIGRQAEGDRVVGQRPHKGLSGWVFAAVLISSAPMVLLIVVPVYVYARERGLRIALWRWTGSAALLVIAGATAQAVVHAGWWGTAPPLPLVRILVAGAVFLAVETALLAACGVADGTEDARWLLATLRGREFYLTEASVLAAAAVVALLYLVTPWFALLTIPSFVMAQRAILHEPLRDRAAHDGKTGLLTHGAWCEAVERELRTTAPCAVVILDLDRFKQVNDRYGHLVGDEVLRAAAQALQGALRAHDLAGRFGGEEFCVFLPGVGLEQAVQVCERARAAVAAVRVQSFPGALTISAGICLGPDTAGAQLLTLVEVADAALYRAKHEGRDRIVVLSSDDLPPVHH